MTSNLDSKTMTRISKFEILGSEKGRAEQVTLDEIVIVADPKTIAKLGAFLIRASKKLKTDGGHLHFQDTIANFDSECHPEVIAYCRIDRQSSKARQDH